MLGSNILNLNGTRFDRVVLNGYTYVCTVFLSGSVFQELSISICWRFLSVSVLGVRMALRRGEFVVPMACEVVLVPEWLEMGTIWDT